MKPFIAKMDLRWADLDPNFHVLHSRYYDFGATCRMTFLIQSGLTPQLMNELQIGPILLREECYFRKELRYGDVITANLKISKRTADGSRWSMEHEIFKNEDTLAAKINIDGAWMNTHTRKLAAPPEIIIKIFDSIVRTDDFQLIIKK